MPINPGTAERANVIGLARNLTISVVATVVALNAFVMAKSIDKLNDTIGRRQEEVVCDLTPKEPIYIVSPTPSPAASAKS